MPACGAVTNGRLEALLAEGVVRARVAAHNRMRQNLSSSPATRELTGATFRVAVETPVIFVCFPAFFRISFFFVYWLEKT